MTKNQIKERINYLNNELIHRSYHDDWNIEGMKEELEWLKKELKKA